MRYRLLRGEGRVAVLLVGPVGAVLVSVAHERHGMTHFRLGTLEAVLAAVLLVRLVGAVLVSITVILLVDALAVLAPKLIGGTFGAVQLVGAVGAVFLPVTPPGDGNAVFHVSTRHAASETVTSAIW